MSESDLHILLQSTLLYGLLPAWMLAGFADWLVHRHQRIECTAGLKEALLHLLMLAQLAPCLLLVLLFEVNAMVLAVLALACVAHELTVWWDLNYATAQRRVPVVEQWVHSFQLASPWVALVALALLHWPQAQALAGFGHEPAQWTLGWKQPALPLPLIATVLAAGGLLIAAPFAEETWRCWRARTDRARRNEAARRLGQHRSGPRAGRGRAGRL